MLKDNSKGKQGEKILRPPKWMKNKGYLHLTPQLNVHKNWQVYLSKIKSDKFVAQYAFYPLIHRTIKERRYKKPTLKKHTGKKRAHKHFNSKTKKIEPTLKERPLHYPTHFDSLIYAYYADKLRNLYRKELEKDLELNHAITAYRKIKTPDGKGKSNIHFAKEAFDEIKTRVEQQKKVGVIALDLKSFFSSLSHSYLYKTWVKLLQKEKLPQDHLNVFKACTNFNYVLYDDLRIKKYGGLDEERLAKIRKKHGFKSFFASDKEMRKAIKTGQLPIYKNPFRKVNDNNQKEKIGIPQGLPISAVLANLYLLEFDREIIEKLVKPKHIFYRRYSDDILIACDPKEMDSITQKIIQLVKKYEVKISEEKTERFLFKKMVYNQKGEQRITAIQLKENICTIEAPLTYLGFEFRGYSTLIKSANLAKYYRRLIFTIKSRAKRAKKLAKKNPTIPKAVYLNQVKRLYNSPLAHTQKTENKQIFRTRHSLVVDDKGEFQFAFKETYKRNSNYISYIKRCDRIFNTKTFSRQLRRKRKIVGQAVIRNLS